MKLDSKYFDKIRVKPASAAKAKTEEVKLCEWPGCDKPGRHRAPKGRGAEGQYWLYCTEHVQAYNKTYNYFDGMKDDEVAGYQKAAQTGHRPTWKLGENAYARAEGARRSGRTTAKDHFNLFGDAPKTRSAAAQKLGRNLRATEIKALNTLGLDETATPEDAKSKYKLLVKRLHPDANGGSRANEDTLKAVIHAYDTLRASGFC
jgi:hypothetical protein